MDSFGKLVEYVLICLNISNDIDLNIHKAVTMCLEKSIGYKSFPVDGTKFSLKFWTAKDLNIYSEQIRLIVNSFHTEIDRV